MTGNVRTIGGARHIECLVAGKPSIQIKCLLVILLQRRVLIFLPQQAVANDQHLDSAAHEASERIFRRAHNRLAPDIETCIDAVSYTHLRAHETDSYLV